MWRANSLEKTLMLGKMESRRIQEWQRMRWLDGISKLGMSKLSGHEFEQTLGDGEGQGAWHATVHGVARSWIQLRDWTTTTIGSYVSIITFNVNRLNSPTKRHRLAGHIKTCACMHFCLPHHPGWPPHTLCNDFILLG